MKIRSPRFHGPVAAVLLAAALAACGDSVQEPATSTAQAVGPVAAEPATEIVVDYPLEGSIFPPDFVPPTFLWHDDNPGVDGWSVEITFTDGSEPLSVAVAGDPPPQIPADPEAFGETNEPYLGTEYQRSARSWTPERAVWEDMKKRSVEQPMTVTFSGFPQTEEGADDAPLSRGSVTIKTSQHPVGAPFFYRDVPLMPSSGEGGKIRPLGDKAIPLIAWRLRDVSQPHSKLVLKGMSSCGNCHSFSLDGKTLGMDVDGPTGDKGMYAIKPISKQTVIDYDDVITWNSFEDKPKGHKTIGFLSRISPDGSTVVSTVNEALYVNNFTNYRFLQVFYPTRGILAYYSRGAGEIRAIPGADDPEYVHCGPVFTPDGKELVFMRAKASDPYVEGLPPPRYPNDPNELPMRYDLYRMPFDDGQGGEAVPVPGASDNGMSNTFAKVSPDGKWLVWVKCKNGLLLRPDSRLWIMPLDGSAEPRKMNCNMELMNSWHSFSPNSRWMVFTSKNNRPYTQAFLTHIDENGNDSPAILVPNCTASNRAVNLPEFLNAPYDALDGIDVPAIEHHVHYLSAETMMKAERYDDAIASLEKAIEADRSFARAHLAMGYAMTQSGRTDEALGHFERAYEIDPANHIAHYNLALSCADAGRPARAIELYEDLLEVAPWFEDQGAATSLATARRQLEQLGPLLEQALGDLEAEPGNASLHVRIAGLYEGAGKAAESIRHLSSAADLEPDDASLAARLAWMLSTHADDDVRDGERAVTVATKAVERTSEKDARALDALAAALAEAGRFDEAVAAAEKAVPLARERSSLLAGNIERRLERYRRREPFRAR